jgi:hypothetical protein
MGGGEGEKRGSCGGCGELSLGGAGLGGVRGQRVGSGGVWWGWVEGSGWGWRVGSRLGSRLNGVKIECRPLSIIQRASNFRALRPPFPAKRAASPHRLVFSLLFAPSRQSHGLLKIFAPLLPPSTTSYQQTTRLAHPDTVFPHFRLWPPLTSPARPAIRSDAAADAPGPATPAVSAVTGEKDTERGASLPSVSAPAAPPTVLASAAPCAPAAGAGDASGEEAGGDAAGGGA